MTRCIRLWTTAALTIVAAGLMVGLAAAHTGTGQPHHASVALTPTAIEYGLIA